MTRGGIRPNAGRKPGKVEVRDKVLPVRVSEARLTAWREAAAREGLTLTEWVEVKLDSATTEGEMEAKAMIGEVASLVSDDGTGDLGVIVRQALEDDANATAEEIAEIVREAREEARKALADDKGAVASPREGR
jgi:hypothetical protein